MIERIKLAGVLVSDQARAIDFYNGQLGFRVQADFTAGGERWVEVSPRRGNTALALVAARPDSRQAPGGTACIFFATEDMESTHRELKDAGVQFVLEPQRQISGDSMAVFSDPDGNTFVLLDRA